MSSIIKVIKPGFYTTIQDLGRFGYREFGVPTSGVMDVLSAKFANTIIGNSENDAVFEITLTGPKLKFNIDTHICITGANISPCVNNHLVNMYKPISIKSGDVLTFGKLLNGCRAYLAVLGGCRTNIYMNSRSYYSTLTGKHKIEKEDEIKIEPSALISQKTYSKIKPDLSLFNTKALIAFKGPEYHLLSKKHQDILIKSEFSVSKFNNRMGYQIEETLENNLPSILTSPVLPGTVQLTPSGRLIVLMKDGQTTGGYPRVLQLKEEAINVLGQKKAGDFITFTLLT